MERELSVGETIECGGDGSEGTGARAGLSGYADEESLWLLGMMLDERPGSSGASPFISLSPVDAATVYSLPPLLSVK